MNLSTEKKIMDLENRLVVAKEGEGVGWIGNLGLIDANYCLWNGYAMGSFCIALGTMSGHLWWSMIMWEKKIYTCMCNWVTLLYSRKLTEHYKPATIEKIKIIIIFKKRYSEYLWIKWIHEYLHSSSTSLYFIISVK